jgi:hydroxymethylbilane synthase
MMTLRIATRKSPLAMAQAQQVDGMLREKHCALNMEFVAVTTTGDQNPEQPLWKLEGMGFFTSQIEKTLLEGKADIAVHSFKDLPTVETPGLTIAAVPIRENPADCVVSRHKISSLLQILPSAFVGTSSLRRQAQLLQLRADLTTSSIRGNVDTRLRKLDEGQYDILIMAAAGLIRLGLRERIAFLLEPTEFVPAPAQGALAIQTRAEDKATIDLVKTINDTQSRQLVEAERLVLKRLHPGCHAPVGIFAKKMGQEVQIYAFVSKPDGTESLRKHITGPFEQAQGLAEKLAEELIASGAKEILEQGCDQ